MSYVKPEALALIPAYVLRMRPMFEVDMWGILRSISGDLGEIEDDRFQ